MTPGAKDADLFAIISNFDAAYSAYNGYQGAMERFWTLQYLAQNGITEIEASLFKENMVRADTLPLVLPVMGAQGLPRGARVRVKLGEMDLITLDIGGTVIERLDAPTQSGDTHATALEEHADEDSEDNEVAGPIAIAVDVSDAPDESTQDARANDNPVL